MLSQRDANFLLKAVSILWLLTQIGYIYDWFEKPGIEHNIEALPIVVNAIVILGLYFGVLNEKKDEQT